MVNLENCGMSFLLYPILGLIVTFTLWKGISLISRRVVRQNISKSSSNSPVQSSSLDGVRQGFLKSEINLESDRNQHNPQGAIFYHICIKI